ncbi:glycoside hydrolase family 13 protein [Rossellomorea vietnamensis]|uniref:glycoside hydrolase family 13 protein n=1 Tax=Rossellomorea vietnamensis TaxID=218284 RepID=UPI003090E8AC|nr:alpha-glucosidase [Rossellomorea vietnamensis]
MKGEWWRQAVFYELYVPSFFDGNGDGVGDFKGALEKLDYLKELGIDGIWLTPFYPSPKVDNGYDISDYYGVDEEYGTMDDFQLFIKEAHDRGIKVVADLVLNHTSSEHPWFQESRSSKDHPKRDWYIWKDRPNNWESFFGGSAWELDEATNQYYYHAFAKEQVDLNWHNSEVREEMIHVMKFWLDQGLDGFRLDVINFLKVHPDMKDNPYDEETGEQIHLHDKDQEGILDVIRDLSDFVHQYPDKFMVGEVGSEELDVLRTYSGKDKLDVVFNFNLGSLESFNLPDMYKQLSDMEKGHSEDQIPTLFFGSHDMKRSLSRFGCGDREKDLDRAKLIATLMLTAKGVPFIYYGEEIGMEDVTIHDIREMKDVQGTTAYESAIREGKTEQEALRVANDKGRDASRSPMQWNAEWYHGFSEKKPWIFPAAIDTNVSSQESDPDSILSYYRTLIAIRKEWSSLHSGEYEEMGMSGQVLTYVKSHDSDRVLVLLNFSEKCLEVNLQNMISKESHLALSSKRSQLEFGNTIELLPYEAMIITL